MKKKVNIILLVIVVILWGVVIYKYIAHYFLSESLIINEYKINEKYTSYIVRKKDTFTPKSVNRDPFTSEFKSSNSALSSRYVKRKTVEKKIVDEKPKALHLFPVVNYYGFIKSNNQSNEIILMSVNGSFSKVRFQQEYKGLKVIQRKNDSIEVIFKNEKKWFTKFKR